jgi:amino acid permease
MSITGFNQAKNTTTEPTVDLTIKKNKMLSLFSAIMIIIGSVIGIGIFFKNGTVFRFNHGNPYGVLIC